MNKISLDMVTSWKVLVPAIIIAVVAMMAATFVAKSNADHICTRLIEDETACTIDSWSDWADVGNGDPETGAGVGTLYQVMQKRIGTGVKTITRLVKVSVMVHIACDAAIDSLVGGPGLKDGNGNHYRVIGTSSSTSAICQLEESRTVMRTVPGSDDPECPYVGAPGCPPDVVEGVVETVETTGEVVVGGETVFIDSLELDNIRRRKNLSAGIAAVPSLVSHDGDTTEIRWTSKETTTCRVEGDNGDSWLPIAEVRDPDTYQITTPAKPRTSGSETSSEIRGRTVYTLTCTAFDGSIIEDTTVVDRIPSWNEQ